MFWCTSSLQDAALTKKSISLDSLVPFHDRIAFLRNYSAESGGAVYDLQSWWFASKYTISIISIYFLDEVSGLLTKAIDMANEPGTNWARTAWIWTMFMIICLNHINLKYVSGRHYFHLALFITFTLPNLFFSVRCRHLCSAHAICWHIFTHTYLTPWQHPVLQ